MNKQLERLPLFALMSIVLTGALGPALAIPVFARKYGFQCQMCHVQFPKLNDFGQRYRDNGYQVPGQEGLDRDVIEAGVPIALRSQVGHSSYTVKDPAVATPEVKEFNIGGLDLLTGGVIPAKVNTTTVLSANVLGEGLLTPPLPGPTGLLESRGFVAL